jgi:short-subunit dehydrogenase
MDYQGKVVVITGASMGIGEAIARAFAKRGASVVLSSRSLERSEAARARLSHAERTLAVACDVTRRADLDALLAAALQRFGRVDIWVNNAGYGLIDSVADMDMQECRRLFETNLWGAVEGMRAVIPVMKQQGSGIVVNISSVSGHIAVPYMAAYAAGKHAMNAFGYAARLELKGTGVHVMTVCPGYIATDFAVNSVRGKDARRISSSVHGVSADEVAEAVVRGCERRSREVVVPWKYKVFIRLYQLLPWTIERAMVKRLRPAEQVIAQQEAARSKAQRS